MTTALEEETDGLPTPAATLEELQHWTSVLGRAQQMLIEYAADSMVGTDGGQSAFSLPKITPPPAWTEETGKLAEMQASFWSEGLKMWQHFLPTGTGEAAPASAADKDRRFAAPQWRANPLFDLIRQSYVMLSDLILKSIDTLEGVDPKQREQIRFATRAFVDALSPSNFAFTNPQVIDQTIAARGENLLVGLRRMLDDVRKGQLTHTDASAFELGRNIAATPGKVIRETPLYQLIQYTPTTEQVNAIPLVIFPPWINRFYILDLNPNNSFIRWAVAQGLTVFVVSWKSADSTMTDITMDDYVVGGLVDAIDTVRDLLDVPSVHTIGYCVAGTALTMALAWLAARGEDGKVASATFFTAQVDFTRAGDLTLLVDDQLLKMIETLSADKGFLDGRYMAATFNLLRGRDLIWSYVVNNYLMGADYPAFDLLYWNGDTTNLPARWHGEYLRDLYRDNKLVEPDALKIAGTGIDLSRIRTPAYIQAGREDHIAPAASVWKLTHHLRGPMRFVLAGSGHIAGVINPPAAGKYQYWTNDAEAHSLEAFVAGAKETRGSWWPDWFAWIESHGNEEVKAKGARLPGKGKLKALENAPGRYARTR
jgi:polyhydroxyalkanoate synthase subunit PhaC